MNNTDRRHTNKETRNSRNERIEWRRPRSLDRGENNEGRRHRNNEFDDDRSQPRREGYSSKSRHHRNYQDRSRSPRGNNSRVKLEGYERDESGSYRYRTSDSHRPGSEEPEIEIEKPNYTPSGLLARERNTISDINPASSLEKLAANKVVLKYSEPSDAAPFAPSLRRNETQYGRNSQYRLVCFASGNRDMVESIRLDQLTFYLVGTDSRVAKIPLSDYSTQADEQHAVIQYRLKVTRDKYGDTHQQIKPYIIDLDTKYGTKLNGDTIPSLRYVELRNKDMLQFGKTPLEYIFMEER